MGSSGLVLSLFPGLGLLDRQFEAAGFCVVRGPDLLWGGDVHGFHPPMDRFEGIHRRATLPSAFTACGIRNHEGC